MRRHPRGLRNDRRVDVADRVAGGRHFVRHGPQQHAAVGVLVARVAVREMLADVAERGRAEQRVADRVDQNVCIRMALEPLLVRDLHAANDELSPGDQRVHVESLSYAHLCPSIDSAIAMSSGKVTLRLRRLP